MNVNTHPGIDAALCGYPLELAEGRSVTELLLTDVMKTDATGLVHGGFVFGAADYAAMLAVNDPWVVLGSATEIRFVQPTRVGDRLRFEAQVVTREGRRQDVAVTAETNGTKVFTGTFSCFVLKSHVLDR